MEPGIHLTDSTIRHPICEHLRTLGYVGVKASTLRIYGYGENAQPELAEFQGHVVAHQANITPTVQTGGEG